MAVGITSDLDYLRARLHGRRGRMAEGVRLRELCRIASIPDLARELAAEGDLRDAAALQRELVANLVREMVWLTNQFTSNRAAFLSWCVERFHFENIKLVARALLAHETAASVTPHLIPIPGTTPAEWTQLWEAGSIDALATFWPHGETRHLVASALRACGSERNPFLVEAALDCVWHRALLLRLARLDRNTRTSLQPLVAQEIDLFNWSLATRGHFAYELRPETLSPFHVDGGRISRGLFSGLLAAPDLQTAAVLVAGRLVDSLPAAVDESSMEHRALCRARRMANSIFRNDQAGFGGIFAYIALRRIEVANLIRLSEGIRLGAQADAISARFVPAPGAEVDHV